MATNMQVVVPGRRPGLRRCGWAALLAVTALVLASCNRGVTVGGPGVFAGPPRNAGQLRIMQVRVGGAIPAEGALSYIRVESPAGASLVARQLPNSQELTLRLKPGTYRLVSWQRTCDGNCGYLDPPSDRCTRPFSVAPYQDLDVTIRVNYASGCVIALGG